MPVEQRPTGRVPAAASKPKFHLRLPDVFADQKPAATAAPPRPAPSDPARDPIASARAKLSEKRFLDGHQQVTRMIEGLRDRRRRIFGRLWTASILLTALSIVALAIELVQRTDILHSIGDTVQTVEPQTSPPSRGAGQSAPEKPETRSSAPREWSNQLPEGDAVQSAVYETTEKTARPGAWLPGTIAETDSESPRRGDLHDDPQSRAP